MAEYNTNPGGSKNASGSETKIMIGVGAGVGVVFIMLVIIIVVLLQIGHKDMSGYQTVYDQMEERFAPYLMDETGKEQLAEKKGALKAAIDSEDTDQCDGLVRELDTLEQDAARQSNETLDAMAAALGEDDRSSLYSLEEKDFQQYQAQAEKEKEAGNYTEAKKNYEECQAILDAAQSADSYSMELSQVDVTAFPKVKLYLSIRNLETGEAIENLAQDAFLIYEKLAKAEEYKQITVDKAVQLDENEGLNTAVVADVSASMGSDLYVAEDAMVNFIDSLQYGAGDRAALYSFADTVYREHHFTKKKDVLKKAVRGMETGNMTALYDALVYSISDIVVENGAKCVIAFTDGQENNSRSDKDYVIEKAQQYDIPVYIIGIGSGVDSRDLQDIADQTGGFYRNISSITSMESIYKEIYEAQKSMYVLQYRTQKKNKEKLLREIYIRYSDYSYKIRTQASYTPSEYKIDGFVFYDSDSRYLSEKELGKLSEEEVLIALNEIYARRGYLFTTNDFLIDHFNNCSWYQGKHKDQNKVSKGFNKYEKANVKKLVAYEKKHKLNNRK